MDKQMVKATQEVARNLGQIATELVRLRRLKVQELRQQNPNLKMDQDLERGEYPTVSVGPLVEDVYIHELNEGDEILWMKLDEKETWKTIASVFGRNAGERMPLTVRFGGEVNEEHVFARSTMVTRKVRQ